MIDNSYDCYWEGQKLKTRECYYEIKKLDFKFRYKFNIPPLDYKLIYFTVYFVNNSCKEYFNAIAVVTNGRKFQIDLFKDDQLVFYDQIRYTDRYKEFDTIGEVENEIIRLEEMSLDDLIS